MNLQEIIMTSIALAMDATAVSICIGLSIPKHRWREPFKISMYFSSFQALMPLIGYKIGENVSTILSQMDHWIAFFLLSIIGISMIIESFHTEEIKYDKTDIKTMIPLSIATSIDAFIIGISFTFLQTSILPAILWIGTITFLLTFLGVLIGNQLKSQYREQSIRLGGLLLLIIGIKIVLEHLGFL